jgi:hypothetical protein
LAIHEVVEVFVAAGLPVVVGGGHPVQLGLRATPQRRPVLHVVSTVRGVVLEVPEPQERVNFVVLHETGDRRTVPTGRAIRLIGLGPVHVTDSSDPDIARSGRGLAGGRWRTRRESRSWLRHSLRSVPAADSKGRGQKASDAQEESGRSSDNTIAAHGVRLPSWGRCALLRANSGYTLMSTSESRTTPGRSQDIPVPVSAHGTATLLPPAAAAGRRAPD